MADLVMPIGGTGTQTNGDGSYPCVVDKDVWEANSPSDFMGTDGESIGGGANVVLGAPDGNNRCTLTIAGGAGDFSNAIVGMYPFLSGIRDGLGELQDNDGYYRIYSITSSTVITIECVGLDGVDSTIDGSGYVDIVYLGGAGTSISTANARMADIDLDEYSVTILDNKSESNAGVTLDADSSNANRITWIGTQHVGTGDSSGEFITCTNKTQFPVKAQTGTVTISGDGWHLQHVKFSTNSAYVSLFTSGTLRTVFIDQCWFVNTLASSNAYSVVSTRGTLLNCVVESAATTNTAVLVTDGIAYGNFIKSAASGIQADQEYDSTIVSNNIIVCTATEASYSGIYVLGNSNFDIIQNTNNIIYNYKYGISAQAGRTSNSGTNLQCNNIIWGNGIAGSVGIYNPTADTGGQENIKNNFVGNVATLSSYNDDTVELTANPFKNANGDYSEPSDFWLNDTDGGGASIRNKLLPMYYNLAGTQDNFITGIIQEEITAAESGSASQFYKSLNDNTIIRGI